MLVCSSPKLFAAYHVLRRPPIPRHPSCALSSLTTKKLFRYVHGCPRTELQVYLSLNISCLRPSLSTRTLSCRIFFKTFSLIVNQPASIDAYISTPKGKNLNPRLNLVEPKGLEPSTSCLQSRCSSQLSYGPLSSAAYTYIIYGGRTWI